MNEGRRRKKEATIKYVNKDEQSLFWFGNHMRAKFINH